MLILLFILTHLQFSRYLALQVPFQSRIEWTHLGPFAVGTREYPFLSIPALPWNETSSAIALGGFVYPRSVSEERLDDFSVGIVVGKDANSDWTQRISTTGWTGFQHARFYHRPLRVKETGTYSISLSGANWAKIHSNFSENDLIFGGDSYGKSTYSHYAFLVEGTYDVFVLYTYDIRVSGYPKDSRPLDSWTFSAQMVENRVQIKPGHAPDLIQRKLMGDILGVEIHNLHNESISVISANSPQIDLKLCSSPIDLVAYQHRSIAVCARQTSPISSSISISLSIRYSNSSELILTTEYLLRTRKNGPIKSTFLTNTGAPSYAMYTPPSGTRTGKAQMKVILALHGAGVEPSSEFWTSSLKPQNGGWIVWPLGLTPWGYDWHGPSLRDAKLAVDNLQYLASKFDNSVINSTRIIVIGHSNGGQGAWHFMSHYPDKVLGGVPASGYVKIQDYVPYSLSLGTHYRDPVLSGLLQSHLACFDNDLHASNLADLPILVRHGAEDDNVPVYHSRTMVQTIQSWARYSGSNSSLIYSEVPAKSHWFDTVFSDPIVSTFLSQILRASFLTATRFEFTLTTVDPDETGSLNGFTILVPEIVGTVSRLTVKLISDSSAKVLKAQIVSSLNVAKISFDQSVFANVFPGYEISKIEAPSMGSNGAIKVFASNRHIIIDVQRSAPLQKSDSESLDTIRPFGPLISILNSMRPIMLVVGSLNPTETDYYLSIARRIARDSWSYGRVDCEIILDREPRLYVNGGEMIRERNIVIIGGLDNLLLNSWEWKDWSMPVELIARNAFQVSERIYSEPGIGFLGTIPHLYGGKRRVVLLTATDRDGYELALKAFPTRTGTTVGEYIIVSEQLGQGGILGTGFWGPEWEAENLVSYLG